MKMANSKYLEPGWIRVYVTLITVLFISAFWVYELNTHTDDKKVQHMTVESRDEVKSMKQELGYQKLEIRRVDEAWKESFKEIKSDIKDEFSEIKDIIRNIK